MKNLKNDRILIIQTAFLGDVVLTIPLIMALRRTLPKSHLAVLVTPQVKEILSDNPAIDEIIIFDKKDKERSWGALGHLVRKVKARHFDVAILPHRSFKSSLLAFLAQIPVRIGFNKSEGNVLLTRKVSYRRGPHIHEIDRNLDLLSPLGIQDRQVEFYLNPGRPAINYTLGMLGKFQIYATDLVIGLNPGSVWPTKRYPAEKFAAVADRLIKELNAKIIIIGGAADKEAAARVTAGMNESVINLAGQTTLKQLTALTKRLNLLITNDSGAMHIAVAQQVPVVAIFGPTTADLGFYPYGEQDIVVEKDLPCRPCGKHGGNRCSKNNFACMKLITVSDVFNAVKKRLNIK